MSDVEGVRNLIGTGLVEFVGGLMTRRLRWCIDSHERHDDGYSFLDSAGVWIWDEHGFKTIRPISERDQKLPRKLRDG